MQEKLRLIKCVVMAFVIIVPFFAGCSGFTRSLSMTNVLKAYKNKAITLNNSIAGCQVTVDVTRDGAWHVYEVGDDYVRFRNKSTGELLVYPINAICVREK